MRRDKRRKESGQSLVLVAFSILVFLAFLALAVDGGNVYAQRRAAQVAADAGALAGARVYCLTGDPTTAQNAALEYSVVRNDAENATITVDTTAGTVNVVAIIDFSTAFAHLVGFSDLTAEAEATAGCFSPSHGTSVLPVAWMCQPPVSGLSTSENCEQIRITEETFYDYTDADGPPAGACPTICPELYIIMDSNTANEDIICISDDPINGINCDLDGDGDDDVLVSSHRSWLNLNGGSNAASELVDWITDGFGGTINIHTWVADNNGTSTSVFHAAATRVGDIVGLPVFDKFCEGDDPALDCVPEWDSGDTVIYASSGAGTTVYFHIISFAPFGISCVYSGGQDNCPGHLRAVDLGIIDHNDKSIEGYFIDGYVLPGLGGSDPGGPDTGVFTIFLTN